MNVTCLMLNYQRQENIHRIIPVLKRQTANIKIVLINNGASYTPVDADDTPDEVWDFPYNTGPFARWYVAYPQKGWLYIQDDDIIPTDDRVVEDLITLAMERPRAITGMFCRNIHLQEPFYMHNDQPTEGPTNYVKAISMAVHRKTLMNVRFPPMGVGRSDDIHISLEIGRGEKVHWVSYALRQRMMHLPQLGVGLCHEPGHYLERDKFCEWWLRKEGIN